MNARILFIVEGCLHCHNYKEFIERINSNLPLDKRIKLVDCTLFYDRGVMVDPLISIFKKHIGNTFPVLFFEGIRLDGSNSRIEVESFIRAMVDEEFIMDQPNPFLFEKECYYGKRGELLCEE